MSKLINWIKANKLSAVLILIVLYLFIIKPLKHMSGLIVSTPYSRGTTMLDVGSTNLGMEVDSFAPGKSLPGPVPQEPAPTPDIKDRMIVSNSYISLLVKDVTGTVEKVVEETSKRGGYFVSKNISTPYEGGTASIQLRVPSGEKEALLSTLRGLSVRVVDESENASDITDTYVDLAADLTQLEKTKAKFDAIYERAETIDEILRVQQQITALQRQIDNVKGQMQASEALAKTTLITVNLSTDELALPYNPEQPWRPDVVFKTATRSLVGNLRGAANLVIWLGVYSILLVPLGVTGWVIVRYFRKPKAGL